jgi:formylglycine-generating enzyme required for sulfatase activity
MPASRPRAFATILPCIMALAGGVTPALSHAQEAPAPGSTFQDCPACPVMVVIPAGQFDMPWPPINQGRPYSEGEMRTITIAESFAMGKYEVTFDEWEACVKDKKCPAVKDEGWGRGKRPVMNVTWMDADGYAMWLSRKAGKMYRLPSDSEWEYAARAGSNRSRFFGLKPEQVCEHANVHDLTAKKVHEFEWEHLPCDDKFAATAPVGSFKPNAFGLHDMLGNVWEWVEDCLTNNWRGAPIDGSAWRAGNCSERAYRGGSWINHPPPYVSTADWYKFVGTRHNDLGFRVARALP